MPGIKSRKERYRFELRYFLQNSIESLIDQNLKKKTKEGLRLSILITEMGEIICYLFPGNTLRVKFRVSS